MHNAEKYIREVMQDINENNTRVSNLYIANEIIRDLRYCLWHCFIDAYTYDELKKEIDQKVMSATESQIKRINEYYDKQCDGLATFLNKMHN